MVKAPLILLLVAASAVAAAAANKAKPSFADWLAVDPKKAGAAAAPSSQYEEVETVETCLKAVSTRSCRFFVNYQWESGLACCNGKDYNKDTDSFLSTPEEVGVCDYTVFLTGAEVPVKENINRIASFIATCTMNGHSDECGYPFCDKMVISVQGLVYAVEDAIVSSLPTGPTQDPVCLNIFDFQRAGSNGQKESQSESPLLQEAAEVFKKTPLYEGYKASSAASNKARAAYARDGPGPEYEPGQLYKVDTAVVYYGSMTVLSRVHDAKVDGGWFEYSRIADRGEGTEVDSPNGQYVLDPYTYKMSFTKSKGY